MTDSFFEFNDSNLSTHDNSFNEEEDDTDYDALNNETFGEDVTATDWEEVHEKLTSQLKKQNNEEVSKETYEKDSLALLEKFASCLLDEEGDDTVPGKPFRSSLLTPSESIWWPPNQRPVEQQPSSSKAQTPFNTWWQPPNRTTSPYIPNPSEGSVKPLKVLTVQELEKKMKIEAESRQNAGSVHSPVNMIYENKEMLPGAHMQNGQYGRGRPNMMMQPGRYPQQEPYHRVHHPYPSLPDIMPRPQGPPIPRPMPRVPPSAGHVHPRHSVPMYPRPGPVMPMDQRFMGQQICRPPPPPMQEHPRHERYFHPQQQMQHGYNRSGPPPQIDEYAGLMTPQEKMWLSQIQMMQLNSNQPLQDDFYYLMYQQRQQGNSGRKLGSHNLRNNRDMGTPKPTYTPLQFENSLGKLQIGSVTAPRKIIDTDLVENLENNAKPVEKKSKKILMEIEELYGMIMTMEECCGSNQLNNCAAALPKIDNQTLQDKIITSLLGEGKLIAILSIRKGRKGVLRLLHVLGNPGPVIHRLLLDLAPITRKDTEQTLLSYLPAIRLYLATVPLKALVQFVNSYDTQFLLSNQFTTSVMANLVERAEQAIRICEDEEVVKDWFSCLVRMAVSAMNWVETDRPVVAVERGALNRQLGMIRKNVSDEQLSALTRAIVSLNSSSLPNRSEPPAST